jgi:hypothetical protein
MAETKRQWSTERNHGRSARKGLENEQRTDCRKMKRPSESDREMQIEISRQRCPETPGNRST